MSCQNMAYSRSARRADTFFRTTVPHRRGRRLISDNKITYTVWNIECQIDVLTASV